MDYAIPYLLLIGFYGLMAWWSYSASSDGQRNSINWICFGVTLFFWGFRGFCFYDWMSYYPMFVKVNVVDTSFSNIFLRMEPGFSALMFLCKKIYDNYVFFAFVCTSINLVLLSHFLLRHLDNYPFGLLVCTTIGGILLFTDLMRNAISIFIFINAIDYIHQRKPLRYYTLCLLSLSFHYSAAFYLPLYFFFHKRISKLAFGIIFGVGCLVYALNISLLSNVATLIIGFISSDLESKVRFYLTELSSSTSILNFVFFERVLTGILVIIYMDKLRALRKEANLYINSILAFFILIFFLHEFVTMSQRLALLFACGYWVLWRDLIKCFSIENNKKLFVLFIAGYCFLRILGHTRNVIANYDNVLFDSETFQRRESILNKNFHAQ